MELNRDEIIKALRCCIEGVSTDFNCEKCPIFRTPNCMTILYEESLSLIKELTEENERLRADVAKEFTCGFAKPHKVLECPIFDEIERTKADTVRKMHSEIKERCIKGGIYPAFVASTIAQIANEMEEGRE